jgi:hypothetical protein
MKKLLLLIAAISYATCNAQDLLDFKMQLTPELLYSETFMQSTKTAVKYSGTQEQLQRLRDNGIHNPTLSVNSISQTSIMKTGKVISDSNFIVSIEYLTNTDSNFAKIMPQGTIIYGTCIVGGLPVMDSTSSNGGNEYQRGTLLQRMRIGFEAMKLPEKKLIKGDTFSVTTPLSIPMVGSTLEMTITTKYTLKKIHNGLATFDIKLLYTMKSDMGSLFSGSGDGDGELIYDIKNMFFNKYSLSSDLKMSGKIKGITIETETNSVSIQTAQISPNK